MDRESKVDIPREGSEERWEVFYEELCRRIDHQISQNERLEDQSLFILRIILATIGLLLTAISIIASTGNISAVYPPVGFNEITNLSSDLASTLPYFGETQEDLVAVILVIIISGYFIRSLYNLFIQVPRYSYQVLQPTVLEPSAAAPKMEVYYREGVEMNNVKQSLIEEYSELAQENRETIESTRKSWEKCYKSLQKGTVSFGITLMFSTAILVLKNPDATLISLLIFVLILIARIDLKKAIETLEDYMIVEAYFDISLVLGTLSLYMVDYKSRSVINSKDSVYYIGIALFILTSLYLSTKTLRMDESERQKLFKRTYGLSVLFFSIYLIIGLGTSSDFQQQIATFGLGLIVSFAYLTYASLLMIVSTVVGDFIDFIILSLKSRSNALFEGLGRDQ